MNLNTIILAENAQKTRNVQKNVQFETRFAEFVPVTQANCTRIDATKSANVKYACIVQNLSNPYQRKTIPWCFPWNDQKLHRSDAFAPFYYGTAFILLKSRAPKELF